MQSVDITKTLIGRVTFSPNIKQAFESARQKMEAFCDNPDDDSLYKQAFADISVGGRVVSVLDLRRFKLQHHDTNGKPMTLEDNTPLFIDDVYLTLDDGLGTVSVVVPGNAYDMHLERRKTEHDLVIVTGHLQEVDRRFFNPKTRQNVTHPTGDELRLYGYLVEPVQGT